MTVHPSILQQIKANGDKYQWAEVAEMKRIHIWSNENLTAFVFVGPIVGVVFDGAINQ